MTFDRLISFKRYVLNEDNKILKKSASEVAEELEALTKIASTGILELKDDLDTLFYTIQGMLRGKWLKQQQQFLIPLQKVAYNIKLIVDGDEQAKDQDVAAIISSCVNTIKSEILDKIEGPINNLAVSVKDQNSPLMEPSELEKPIKADNRVSQPSSGFDTSSIAPLGQPPER